MLTILCSKPDRVRTCGLELTFASVTANTVLNAAIKKITVFWDITPCSVVDVY